MELVTAKKRAPQPQSKSERLPRDGLSAHRRASESFAETCGQTRDANDTSAAVERLKLKRSSAGSRAEPLTLLSANRGIVSRSKCLRRISVGNRLQGSSSPGCAPAVSRLSDTPACAADPRWPKPVFHQWFWRPTRDFRWKSPGTCTIRWGAHPGRP
jgi:hypothetical protein